MKKQLSILLVAAFVVGFTASATALTSDNSDTTTMNVSVAQNTVVDVQPATLTFNNVDPGSRTLTSTDRNYQGVEIENTGSRNVSRLWVGNTYPEEDPFGTGVASEYDTGNMVIVRPTGELTEVPNQPNYHYASRKDFNASGLNYVKTSSDGTGQRYGRFRAGNESVFWHVEMGTEASQTSSGEGSRCDGGNDGSAGSATLKVGNVSHHDNRLGSVNFKNSNDDYSSYTINNLGSTQYGIAENVEVNLSYTTREYDVLTYCGADSTTDEPNSTFVIRSRYNVQPGGTEGVSALDDLAADGSRTDYLLNSSNSDNDLQPGEHLELMTGIQVPTGTAEGDLSDGTMTIYASVS